jgi:hypothetical protein
MPVQALSYSTEPFAMSSNLAEEKKSVERATHLTAEGGEVRL